MRSTNLTRSLFITLLASLLILVAAPASAATAEDGVHRLIIHVDDNEAQRMNIALNNAANITKHYLDKGEEITIEIVTHGPGLHMLRADTSPVKDRLKIFEQNYENISFKGCGNTKSFMEKKSGKEVVMLPQAEMVPAGIVHMVERQEQGWSYVRP